MNRKFLAVVTSVMLVGLVFTATPVQAQEQEDVSIGEVSDPGILPDSPFYFAKSWGRAIRSFFTFNTLEKAQLTGRYANEDVLAIEKLCNKGKYQLAEKHCEKFQEQSRRAVQLAERAKQEGGDVEELIEKLKENQLRQQQVLAGVLGKVPEHAQEAILDAAVNSIVGLENAIGRIQQKQEMEQFREELNLRLKNVSEEIQLRIQERLEAERNRPEEAPAGETQQEKHKQGSPSK